MKKNRLKDEDKLIRVSSIIIWECPNHLSAKELAKRVNMDVEDLKIKYKKWSTRTLDQEYYFSRIIDGKIMLEQKDRTISSIAEKLRFPSSHAFSQAFKRWFDISPTAYRKTLKETPTLKATTRRTRKQLKRA